MCNHEKENGKPPVCTHDCNGCIFHEKDDTSEEIFGLNPMMPRKYSAKERAELRKFEKELLAGRKSN